MTSTSAITKRRKHHSKTKTPSLTVATWQDDPADGDQPTGGRTLIRPVPTLNSAPFALSISGRTVKPQVYAQGTPEFRYWVAAEAAARGRDFWRPLLPGGSWNPAVGAVMPIKLDEGEDFNAFYDRIGLNFFHGTAAHRVLFSGESPDVVCHELGHAILDSFKPQLWDAAFIEVAALHEGFGDCSAILSALQLAEVRQDVIASTGGKIFASSRLSRLAEQLGWAIRQTSPSDVDPDCLRNAFNNFDYQDPDTLPTFAPANQLSSEPHSFSRVFAAAFFDALAGVFRGRAKQDVDTLLSVSTDMGRALVAGITRAAVTPAFYSQVAAGILQSVSDGDRPAVQSAFVKHAILAPRVAVDVTARSTSLRSAVAVAAPEPAQLGLVSFDASDFGLGDFKIQAHASSERSEHHIMGLTLGGRVSNAPSEADAAKSFIMQLVKRGRLDTRDYATAVVATDPAKVTHRLQSAEDGFVLKRIRVACGCTG